MIAEIWSGRTRSEHRDTVTRQLQATIEAKIKSAAGCRGAYLLQRQIDADQVETLILTLYEPGRGSESPREDRDGTVTCYEVITDPPRTLLYAELSRRFPLRSMAPR